MAPDCSPGEDPALPKRSRSRAQPTRGSPGWGGSIVDPQVQIRPGEGLEWSSLRAKESSAAVPRFLAASPGPGPAFLCPAQTQKPHRALSLHCLNKCNQSPPCPTGNPGAFRGKNHKIWVQRGLVTPRTQEFPGSLPRKCCHNPWGWLTYLCTEAHTADSDPQKKQTKKKSQR